MLCNGLHGKRIFKSGHMYMYNWFTLLYSKNEDILSQLYSNTLKKKKKEQRSHWRESYKTNGLVLFCEGPVAQTIKRLPAMWIWSLGQEDPLEKEMAPHSGTLAWRIPRTEKPGGLWSMESQRVGHDWVTSLHLVKLEVRINLALVTKV